MLFFFIPRFRIRSRGRRRSVRSDMPKTPQEALVLVCILAFLVAALAGLLFLVAAGTTTPPGQFPTAGPGAYAPYGWSKDPGGYIVPANQDGTPNTRYSPSMSIQAKEIAGASLLSADGLVLVGLIWAGRRRKKRQPPPPTAIREPSPTLPPFTPINPRMYWSDRR